MNRSALPALLLALAPFAPAQAAPVFWTDWTTASTALVTGTITAPGTTVGVSASGLYSFAQTAAGTNFWIPSAPYTSTAVDNPPPGTDIVALSTGGTETITFSTPVVDPLIALVSWNGNTVEFGTPIEVLSFGQGFWGSGTPVVNGTGTGFFGSGEVHGVIRLPGTFSSISFRHTSENWHGFSVGITSVVPEPDSRWLLALGLPLLALGRRRRA